MQFHYMYLDLVLLACEMTQNFDLLTCLQKYNSHLRLVHEFLLCFGWRKVFFLFASCNCHTTQLSDLSCLEHEVKSWLYIHLMDLPSKLGEAKKKRVKKKKS